MVLFSFFSILVNAQSVEQLSQKLNLLAGTKAIIQWERVFSSQKRQMDYGIYNLNVKEKNHLKNYLIKHAADSDHPIVERL